LIEKTRNVHTILKDICFKVVTKRTREGDLRIIFERILVKQTLRMLTELELLRIMSYDGI
jgi:hypothetical protein